MSVLHWAIATTIMLRSASCLSCKGPPPQPSCIKIATMSCLTGSQHHLVVELTSHHHVHLAMSHTILYIHAVKIATMLISQGDTTTIIANCSQN